MQDAQTLMAGQRLGLHAERLEVVDNINFDPVQLGFCGFD